MKGNFNYLFDLCVVLLVLEGCRGQSVKTRKGSSGTGSRWGTLSSSQNEQQFERLKQPELESNCERPSIRNGAMQCQMTTEKQTCTGTCNPGSEFPDGSSTMVLECFNTVGIWIPYDTFPDCSGGGYGYSQEGQSYGPYSQQDSYGGGSSWRQYSDTQGSHGGAGWSQYQEEETCERPASSPRNGKMSCSLKNGQWSCTATCLPGSEFPDGTDEMTISCDVTEGRWYPQEYFEDCIGGSYGDSSWGQYSNQESYGGGGSYEQYGQHGSYGGNEWTQYMQDAVKEAEIEMMLDIRVKEVLEASFDPIMTTWTYFSENMLCDL